MDDCRNLLASILWSCNTGHGHTMRGNDSSHFRVRDSRGKGGWDGGGWEGSKRWSQGESTHTRLPAVPGVCPNPVLIRRLKLYLFFNEIFEDVTFLLLQDQLWAHK